MTGTNPCLAEFCAEEKIRCPETPIRHQLCPASPEDAGLFYAQTPEKDEELGAIGHVRIDFGLPTDLLETFMAVGTCLSRLEEHLIAEDTVYGG